MNNTQFRNLLLSEPSPQTPHGTQPAVSSASGLRNNASSTTSLLGSRARSSMPMTPRSVGGHSSTDFARQVAELKHSKGQPPRKKVKVSAPKGSKLAAGYQDRAAMLRQQELQGGNANGASEGEDDVAERVKALEEMVKLQQIDQATFEKLRDEMGVGGEVGSTHLIKGLDWRLLERVKKGDDVMVTITGEEVAAAKEEHLRIVEEELENVLEKEVEAVKREEMVKKGEMAPPPSLAGSNGRLSRDEILKRLKAERAVAVRGVSEEKRAEPLLGSKFRKVGSETRSERKKLIETVNGRRREVLVITHADGTSKRKVKWIDEDSQPSVGEALGMEVPGEILAKQKAILEKQKLEEAEDDDIFAGVGAEYNPLGADADECSVGSSDDSHSEAGEEAPVVPDAPDATASAQTGGKARNYFSNGGLEDERVKPAPGPVVDADLLAALKRAAALRQGQEGAAATAEGGGSENGGRSHDFLERLKKREREDAADLDLGFGESRFGDEEDEDGPVWNGEDGDGDGERKQGRKRGSKKKKGKGNKDEIGDVMAVLERGKKASAAKGHS